MISVSEGFFAGGGGRGGGRLPDFIEPEPEFIEPEPDFIEPDFIDGGRGGALGDGGGVAEADKCGERGGFGGETNLTSATSGVTNEWRSGGTGDCRLSTTASCERGIIHEHMTTSETHIMQKVEQLPRHI